MIKKEYPDLVSYLLQIADNALVIGHRLSEWCGHGPVLEQDIALTNLALDQFGQARLLYQHAAELQGDGSTEDTLAYTRDAWDFKNILLVEQENIDFAHTIVRQFLFDNFNELFFTELLHSSDQKLAAIAEKSLKEIKYHYRYSSEWLVRLGDGTDLSREKMQTALNNLWMYKEEAYQPNALDLRMLEANVAPDLVQLKKKADKRIDERISLATLKKPTGSWFQMGGKDGRHTEYLGFILSEFQFLQRAYPDLEW